MELIESDKHETTTTYHQAQMDYSEWSDGETFGHKQQKLKDIVEEPKVSEIEKQQMNPRQRKLLELREKMSEQKRKTREAVVEEDKYKRTPESDAKKERVEEWAKRKEDPDRTDINNMTAAKHEAMLKKKRRKKGEAFGWNMYNDDVQAQVYHKRQADSTFSQYDYDRQKEKLGDKFYKGADDLDYGSATGVSVDGVNRMVEELEKSVNRRSKFSRRRAHNADNDISYINDRNKKFNEKVSRAFDKYTVEIRANLERGTALT